MSESFGRNKENAFVTSSLSEQTCFVETRSYIEYTDWHGEQIQINESLNKQKTTPTFLSGAREVVLNAETMEQQTTKAKGRENVCEQYEKPQMARQSCCASMSSQQTHSWDNKGRSNLLMTDNSVFFMRWMNRWFLWGNLSYINKWSARQVLQMWALQHTLPSWQQCLKKFSWLLSPTGFFT